MSNHINIFDNLIKYSIHYIIYNSEFVNHLFLVKIMTIKLLIKCFWKIELSVSSFVKFLMSIKNQIRQNSLKNTHAKI
jgi:hypothetical protein